MLPYNLAKQLENKQGTDKVTQELLESAPRGISHVEYFRDSINKFSDNSKTVFETSEPCYIEYLVFQSNFKEAWFQLMRKDNEGGVGVAEGILRTTTRPDQPIIPYSNLRPEDLNRLGGETSIWKEALYDEQEDHYVFYLKQPLHCPTGFRLRLHEFPEESTEGEYAMSADGSVVFYSYPGGV